MTTGEHDCAGRGSCDTDVVPERWDVVAVGAGPNGLTAAVRLARAGRRVLVVERAQQVGGNARTAELLVDGIRHDLGAAVLPFAVASPAFKELALPVAWAEPEIALAHPLDGGRAATLVRDVAATAARLGNDARQYRRLVAPFVEHFDDLVVDALAPQLKVPASPVLMARFAALAGRPASWVAHRFAGDEGRALLTGIAAHATVPPTRPLTAGVGLTLLAAAHAVGWPVAVGGTQAVPDALARLLVEAGGEIRLGTEVSSLDDLPARAATVLDLTPRQASALVPEVGRAYRRWRYGPGACKVDYVLSGPVPWMADACRRTATVHVGGTAAEMTAAEREVADGRLPDRPFVLVAQPAVADPTRVVAGNQPLWTYTHVPHGSHIDASAAMERQIDRFAPGWRDLIVAKRVLTAHDSEATNPNLVGGDLAGGLMTISQMLLGPRPLRSPYRSGAPGVYLCSSSTPPGAGVHGMCGWHAAGALLRDGRPDRE